MPYRINAILNLFIDLANIPHAKVEETYPNTYEPIFKNGLRLRLSPTILLKAAIWLASESGVVVCDILMFGLEMGGFSFIPLMPDIRVGVMRGF
jgi:hypothetical protein